MKSFFLLLLAFTVHLSGQAQDLTGTWEGQQDANGKQYRYTLYLSKADNNGYTGVTYLKETLFTKKTVGSLFSSTTKITLNASVLDKKPSAKAFLLGSFSNNTLKYSELAMIKIEGDPKNWALGRSAFSYVQVNGKEKLTGGGNAHLELTKKSNEFPSEYAQYALKEILSVKAIDFTNSGSQNKIKFNDLGTLSFTLINNAPIDITRVNIGLFIREKGDIKANDGGAVNLSVPQGQNTNGSIDIRSGFDLPVDSVHFVVQGTYNEALIFSKNIALATIPFYLTDKVVVNKSSSATFAAVQGFYGFNKTPFSSTAPSLDQLVLAGNKFAPMWKAIFKTTGRAGYALDESAGVDLAKKVYKDISYAARNGDAEAQYLMFYAVGMGISGPISRDVAGAFLKRAADAGYLPAMYDYAQFLQSDKKYDESYALLLNCYDKGMQKAAVKIGNFNQKGYAVSKEPKKAIEWYQKGEVFGDPEALMQLATIYTDGEDIEPDAPKAIAYATKAAALKNSDAMSFLAKIYLNGRNGVPKNVLKAVSLYKEAAYLGDNSAMASLAYLYLKGSPEVPQDDKTALFWTRKSAEAGGADCMSMLGKMYDVGVIVDKKDTIKARFWTNQALLNGIGQKDNSAQDARDKEMSSFINNIDLSDQHTLYKDYYGNAYISNDGPDIVGGIFKSFMGTYLNRQAQHQIEINGLEYIYEAKGKKTYGGTLTSQITTELFLRKGQKVKIKGYGTVNFGVNAGVGTPNGVASPMFQSYCLDSTIPHGAIMASMNNGWTFIGSDNTFIAPTDGNLRLAVNDNDYTHNIGYFDIVLTIEK